MISATLRRPHFQWGQHGDSKTAAALLTATSESLALLGGARRLAFAPPEVTDWLASCSGMLDEAAQTLAAPLTRAIEHNRPGDCDQSAPCPMSTRIADHASLADHIKELGNLVPVQVNSREFGEGLPWVLPLSRFLQVK